MSEEVSGEAAESWDKEQEDEEEHKVRSNRNNHVDEAENSHVDLEESERRLEHWVGSRCRRVCWVVGDRGIEVRCKCSTKCEPESAEAAEDNEGEGISENEFKKRADDHEETTEEPVCTTVKMSELK